MVLQEFKILFLTFFVFIGCASLKNQSYKTLGTDMVGEFIQTNNKNYSVKNKNYSIVVARLFVDGKPVDKRFFSYCTLKKNDKSRVRQKASNNYYGEFQYGDLLISFLARPLLKGSDLIHRNSLIFMNDNKRMVIKINPNHIGQDFYFDSLIFKEGQYYLDIKKGEHKIVSLKDKLNELENWKKTDRLINNECIERELFYKKADETSDKNLIQDILRLNYFMVEQGELTTKRIF